MWERPSVERLGELFRSATHTLLICSPWISSRGVSLIAEAVPKDLGRLEVWCRLNVVDWLQGRSDYVGLLSVLRPYLQNGRGEFRTHDYLHAKFFLASPEASLAGSPNLTTAGLYRNFEVWSDADLESLADFADQMRPRLSRVPLADLEGFVRTCEDLRGKREEILEGLREAQGTYPAPGQDLIPIEHFIEYCCEEEERGNPIARQIMDFYTNRTELQVTGHIKQAYYAAQRFLQEAPEHIQRLSNEPIDEAYELQESPMLDDWLAFLELFEDEEEPSYGFRMSVLQNILPDNLGGDTTGGGGAGYKVKAVLPLLARFITQG